MSAAKDKGTRAETAIVNYLRANGYPKADRHPLRGRADQGDIAGIDNVTIEVKNKQRMDLAEWVDEVSEEQIEALTRVGVVWHKRRGHGSPADWYVTMTGDSFIGLLKGV